MQPDAFDQIYQNYFESVYRYALSLSGNPQIAEEIAQETFLRPCGPWTSSRGKAA